jgi:Tim44-like domain
MGPPGYIVTVRKGARALLVVAITMAVVLTIQVSALARAGGGHSGGGGGGGGGHSSGGGTSHGSSGGIYYVGGSGSSGSSSGSGSLAIFFIVIGLVGAYLIYRWWASRQSDSSTSTDAPLAAPPVDIAAVESGIQALQARDPNFNQQVFLDRAQQTFFVLQNAWMARNLSPARVYLSDGIYNRWQLQINQMLAMHKRNVLEDLAINGCTIARVAGDPNFDSITVRIDAWAADYEVDDQNKLVSGDQKAAPFTEYWTFIRSRAARTRVEDTAQITQCPNCGAPVQLSESGVCAYCKAVVTSGQFGWVLDNITQADQWSAAA